ncbi:MAG: hypothetical protein AAF770_02145 [Bacteroidota bacterium]
MDAIDYLHDDESYEAAIEAGGIDSDEDNSYMIVIVSTMKRKVLQAMWFKRMIVLVSFYTLKKKIKKI